jgi:predicted nucleic acid-binding protein
MAIDDLMDLAVAREPHDPLLERIWALTGIFTAYDAAYVALAEALGAALLTRDARLARAATRLVEVELV